MVSLLLLLCEEDCKFIHYKPQDWVWKITREESSQSGGGVPGQGEFKKVLPIPYAIDPGMTRKGVCGNVTKTGRGSDQS